MTLTPLLDASIAIQMHVCSALLAALLTPFLFLRRKGDRTHKLLGRIWWGAMAITALSSFAITGIRLVGPFSPIHLLSLLTLFSLVQGVRYARAGKITGHKQSMLGAMGGLVGAGLFTVLPGRLMSKVLFEGIETIGFLAVLMAGALLLIAARSWAQPSDSS